MSEKQENEAVELLAETQVTIQLVRSVGGDVYEEGLGLLAVGERGEVHVLGWEDASLDTRRVYHGLFASKDMVRSLSSFMGRITKDWGWKICSRRGERDFTKDQDLP